MVDPQESPNIESFDVRKHDQYNYFVVGGSHSAEARRQLVREHPTTFFFKYAEFKIYVGLTTEEAKPWHGTKTMTMTTGRKCHPSSG